MTDMEWTPPHVEMTFTAYLTSIDEEGLNLSFSITGNLTGKPDLDRFTTTAIEHAKELTGLDYRPMTPDEIKEFKEDNND